MERLRSSLRYGLFAVLLLTPLPFGSVEPSAVLALELSAALLGAGAVVLVALDPARPSRAARICLALLGAVLALGVVQLMPLPESWVAALAAPVAAARRVLADTLPAVVVGPAPLSLSAPDTLDAVLRLGAYLLLGLTAVVTLRERRDLERAALVIVAAATFQALYGSFEYLSGRQRIFAYAKQYYLDEATGTFINRNHFAAYLAMALPFALGLIATPWRRGAGVRSWRERALLLTRSDALLRLFGVFATFCIWVGVILSYSRGGLAAALLASLIAGAVLMRRRRRLAVALLCALALPMAFLMYLDVNAPGERLGRLGRDLAPTAGRPLVWQATAHIAADHPLLGSGLGTFESAFPAYRPPGLRAHWDHAHNDWLQAAAAGGIPLIGLLVALAVVLLRPRRRERGGSETLLALSGCAAAGIAAVAFHSLIDFSLRIPAAALLLVVLASIRLGADRLLEPRAVGIRPA